MHVELSETLEFMSACSDRLELIRTLMQVGRSGREGGREGFRKGWLGKGLRSRSLCCKEKRD